MKIDNVRVYGLKESIIASGYPMQTEGLSEREFDEFAERLYLEINDSTPFHNEDTISAIKRAKSLASAKQGSGHNCFLKGVIVQYDLTAPEYFWRQFDRYHFHDYISSQSKMHRLVLMDLNKMCNKYVDQRVIDIVNEYISIYNDMLADNLPKERLSEVFQQIISNCPMGIELTARITDNYLQLKSKYHQRKNHKLEEWKYYCDWIKTLPMARELIRDDKKTLEQIFDGH